MDNLTIELGYQYTKEKYFNNIRVNPQMVIASPNFKLGDILLVPSSNDVLIISKISYALFSSQVRIPISTQEDFTTQQTRAILLDKDDIKDMFEIFLFYLCLESTDDAVINEIKSIWNAFLEVKLDNNDFNTTLITNNYQSQLVIYLEKKLKDNNLNFDITVPEIRKAILFYLLASVTNWYQVLIENKEENIEFDGRVINVAEVGLELFSKIGVTDNLDLDSTINELSNYNISILPIEILKSMKHYINILISN